MAVAGELHRDGDLEKKGEKLDGETLQFEADRPDREASHLVGRVPRQLNELFDLLDVLSDVAEGREL